MTAAISPEDGWRWVSARADETLLGPVTLDRLESLIREGETKITTPLWVGTISGIALLPVPTFIIRRSHSTSWKEVEEEFRLPPVVEFMADEADEVLNRVKIEPSVAELDDISKDDPFYVDGEEGGSD
jgi:hypothetical protein